MKRSDNNCHSLALLKTTFMKKNFSALFINSSSVILQLIITGFIIFYLAGCSCYTYCTMTSILHHKINPRTGKSDCDELCRYHEESGGNTNSSADSVSGGNNVQRTRKLPGEYFSNIISAGPNLSFKNSDEKFTYEEKKNQPAVGFQLGIGTAFPISKKFGLAPSVQYKQTSASEKLSYSSTGGGSSSSYKETCKYSYIAATVLAEYWAGNHFAIAAGPELNYLTSAALKSSGTNTTTNKENIKKRSTALGVDIKLGFKYEIPAKNNQRSKWGMSLFYSHRLSRLNKKEDMGYPVAGYKMKSLQLGLNYFWCVKCGK